MNGYVSLACDFDLVSLEFWLM